MKFLNGLHFVYKSVNAMTTAAITAITMPSGPANNAPAPLRIPKAAFAAAIAFLICPSAVTNLPIPMTTGPTAAATIASFTMKFCCPGDRFFHLADKSLRNPDSFLSCGATTVAIELPMSAPVDFISFIVILNWSIGSRVVLKVLFTLPENLPMSLVKPSSDNFPVFMAL